MSSNNVTSNNNYSREQRQSKQSQYKDFENSKHVTSQVYEVADTDVVNEAGNQAKINGLTLERLQLANALSTDYAKTDAIENEMLSIERIGTQYR